ncbi:MAG TPA: hypothetical protein VD884_19315 [Ohtaekwangia sp.]|nr:hypothetical protein [Ohtaekwangia sp.]
MKTLALVLSFIGIASVSFAQNPEREYPNRAISKDVQRLQFNDVNPLVEINTGTATMVVSKGIHAEREPKKLSGKVAMTGTPGRVISKGVARMQYEKTR